VPNPRLKTTRIVLPKAAPQLYLAWMAFTVTVEQRLRDHPSLLAKAARAGFVTTPPAQIAHRVVLGPLTEQAEAAFREERAVFVPVLEGGVVELAAAGDYLQRWGEWLVTTDPFGPAGISFPPADVAAIRTAALKAIYESAHGRN
jgi:hypothetical protein